MRFFAFVLGLALSAAGSAGAASIAGIVAGPGGEPLASVSISLVRQREPDAGGPPAPGFGAPTSGQTSARTGPDGSFRVDGLAPGDYALSFQKTGYEGGQRIVRRATVVGEKGVVSLRVEMRRSASIEGRATDPDGDPLPGVFVQLRAWTMQAGRRVARPVRSARADDRGEYRLFDIPAGRYYVSFHSPGGVASQGAYVYEYQGGYFPGTPSIDEAMPVTLAWGQELRGVDFRFASAPPTLLSGTAYNDDGTVCGGCSVMISLADGMPMGAAHATREGRFAVQGLPRGEVTLSMAGHGPAWAAERVFVPADRPVEIALHARRPQKVAGRVRFEGPVEGGPPRLDRAAIRLDPLDTRRPGRNPEGPVETSGEFRIEQAPAGEYRVEALRLPAGAYISRVLLSGAEAPGGVVRVPPDGPLEDMEVRVRLDGGAIRGRAVDDRGDPAPANGMAVLLPLEPPDGRPPVERIGGYSSATGEFNFPSLPPGDYLLWAGPPGFVWDWTDPADSAQLRRLAQRVRVRAKETTEAEAPYVDGP